MKQVTLKATAFAALTALFAIAQAAAQQPAPAAPSIAGEYSIAQVDNGNLPILIAEKDGCRQELTAGKLSVTADNKYTLETTIKETCGDKVQEKTTTERGALTAAGAKLTFAAEASAAPAANAVAAVEKVAAAPAELIVAQLSTGIVEDGALKVTLKSNKVVVFKK
jgi:hypothetical protein